MALSYNPKRLHNYIQHDIISNHGDMNRARTAVPFALGFASDEKIERPSTTINRMSPMRDCVEEFSIKKKGNLCIQTSFTDDEGILDFDPLDSPIVRSQNPLLQSPIPRSQNPLVSPSNPNVSPFLDSTSNFVRRASCLSTSTSTSSRFSPFL